MYRGALALGERIGEPNRKLFEILLEREGSGRLPHAREISSGYPASPLGRAELRDGSPRDRDRELLTGLGATENLSDVVAQLLLRNRFHRQRVALLLPGEVVEHCAHVVARQRAEADGPRAVELLAEARGEAGGLELALRGLGVDVSRGAVVRKIAPRPDVGR